MGAGGCALFPQLPSHGLQLSTHGFRVDPKGTASGSSRLQQVFLLKGYPSDTHPGLQSSEWA